MKLSTARKSLASTRLFIAFLVLLVVGGGAKASSVCSRSEFRCGNGRCVPLSWTCDKEDDCGDNSDEETECFGNVTCLETDFRCGDGGRCLPSRWQCDGEPDCDDGSDEADEICASRTCGPEEWSCRSRSGQCIPLAWLCDEHEDCEDASDEKLAECVDNTCASEEEFTCDNGRCIQKRWLCDGEDDCGDASDERECENDQLSGGNGGHRGGCDPEEEFACGGDGGYCVTKRWRCDGDFDCPDASDERDCEIHEEDFEGNGTNAAAADHGIKCGEREFRCRNRYYCVHRAWVCDGEPDCPDGSDESAEECGENSSNRNDRKDKTQSVRCRSDQFACADGLECIPGHLQCSGSKECRDGSDEDKCGDPNLGCDPTSEFDCAGDGTLCVGLDRVCDRKNDCGNWQDEPPDLCGVDECRRRNGGCEHKCVDMKLGFRCECKQGYELKANGSCVDVDECLIPGKCSQRCYNKAGGFKCACGKGYLRDPRDPTRCKAAEGHTSLIFAHKTDIRKISLERGGPQIPAITSIVNETRSSCAVDYVFRTGTIFWSDVMTQKIYKAPLDEGHKKEVVIDDHVIVTADGIACDWIYSRLYWTDTGTNSIMTSDFDGKLVARVIKDDLEEPRAIAVHPEKGWIFWSDWGEKPRIERSGMDGSHRSVVVQESVRWPNGITLDLDLQRIYWIDAKLNLVGSADLDGANSRVVFYSREVLKHPFSVSVFEDWMYWSDWDKNAIFRANKFNGSQPAPVTPLKMKQIPMVVHVYHPYRQPEAENYCLAMNGGCSHICLPAPQLTKRSAKTTCFCPLGMKLDASRLNCVVDPLFVEPGKSLVVKPAESLLLDVLSSGMPASSFFDTFQDSNFFETEEASAPFVFNNTKEDAKKSDGGSNIRDTLSAKRNRFPGEKDGDGLLAGIFVGAIAGILVVAALLAVALYRKFWYKSLHTINFDNPVYRSSSSSAHTKEMSTGAATASRAASTTAAESTQLTQSSSLASSLISTPSITSANRNFTSSTLVSEISEVEEREPLRGRQV